MFLSVSFSGICVYVRAYVVMCARVFFSFLTLCLRLLCIFRWVQASMHGLTRVRMFIINICVTRSACVRVVDKTIVLYAGVQVDLTEGERKGNTQRQYTHSFDRVKLKKVITITMRAKCRGRSCCANHQTTKRPNNLENKQWKFCCVH